VADNSPVWVEKGEKINSENIITTTRIGITKATDLPWRFYIKDNKFISKK
jgi:DNA-3-methyladenine glycosylase